LAACGSDGTSTTSATTAGGPADLSELAAAIEGEVVLPSSPDYKAARLVWDARYDGARPVGVVQALNARDVATTVDFARDNGVPLTIRGGGHSFGGYSTGDGLVLDLSPIDAVSVDDGAERGRIGAGATMLDIYRDLWTHKKAISGGTCPTVGVSGLATGGGLGVLSRRYGLTSDTLTGVEIVTADGKLLTANERENADLFWATRGGGGGTFGVLTSLEFELLPVDMRFTHAHFEFPWSRAAHVLDAWQQWLPSAPGETWSAIELLTQAPEGNAPPQVAIEIVHAGPKRSLAPIAAPLLDEAGVAPTVEEYESGPFFSEERDFYCKGLRPDECVLADKTAAGQVPRAALASRSDVAKGPWPRAGLDALVEAMERRQYDRTLTPKNFDPAHTIGKVLIEAADGAVNGIKPDATAFVHRDNLFVAQYQSRWRRNATPETVDANLAWANQLYSDVEPYRSGFAYQNYIDPDLDNWEQAYYGDNLPRLREIKAKHDPDDFFSFAQSVPPAAG
jgi:FAD/FMN-containing dehydrogenase